MRQERKLEDIVLTEKSFMELGSFKYKSMDYTNKVYVRQYIVTEERFEEDRERYLENAMNDSIDEFKKYLLALGMEGAADLDTKVLGSEIIEKNKDVYHRQIVSVYCRVAGMPFSKR